MGRRSFDTVGRVLFWSYANLAMADAAVRQGAAAYGVGHFVIRQRLFAGLCNGSMSLGSLYDDEREKLLAKGRCSYCGSTDSPTLDHLWPRGTGGGDAPENLVFACRSCNSSKGKLDVLIWAERQGRFPPLSILRRHLKLAIRHCEVHGHLERPTAGIAPGALPFDLTRIPMKYPAPDTLVWAY